MPDLPAAPSTARNTEPIMAVLRPYLPERGCLLEVASGYGEHALHIARQLPALRVQPSDASDAQLEIIRARQADAACENFLPPLQLNAMDEWTGVSADLMLSINMIHISPWSATEGLFRNAAVVLPDRGLLFTYGPYVCVGVETAESNRAFDLDLKRRNPEWGVRHLDEVVRVAEEHGFRLEARHDCPANNSLCVFRK